MRADAWPNANALQLSPSDALDYELPSGEHEDIGFVY
jgi:hypothetical protein